MVHRRLYHLVPLILIAACAPQAGTARAPVLLDPGVSAPALPEARPISAAEYASRRAALAERMEDGLFIAIGAPLPTHDYLPFAQDPYFAYLTGTTEPAAALLIAKRGGDVVERLFVLPRDPAREVWEGARLGVEGARAHTGVETTTTDRLESVVAELYPAGGRLYSPVAAAPAGGVLMDAPYQARVLARIGESLGAAVVPIGSEILALRGVKSETELDLLRRAVAITTIAQRNAMRTVEPGMNEFEIQALIEYTFRRHGADRPGFASIVGSGPNATTLHYNANDRFMSADDMLVMDIGASYRGYTADVTRSVPVSGRFSAEQRAIYEIVLRAQKAAESIARPGATWNDLMAAASNELAAGLARIGLIESPTATYDCGAGRSCPQYRLFFMHGLGHGIGLQVHDPDAADLGAFRTGSVFTIEPGLYVRGDALDHIPDTPENRRIRETLAPVVARYRNIGVRIEDDYIITANGADRISAAAPREIDEIEALMAMPGLGAADRSAEIVDWYRQTEPGR